jgi:hypothetical protein
LDVGLLGKLKKQWLDKCFVNVVGDARAATSSDKTKPARYYWIRMWPFWKELSEMMLFWLAVPISTACVERGFSHMTGMGMDANVLWRSRTFATTSWSTCTASGSGRSSVRRCKRVE